ncbi:RBL1 family protein [Megaselia abdita]
MAEGIKTNLEPNPEVAAKTKHDEYCRELNMDKETQEESWKNYVNTIKKHVLEGDQSLWLCCSIYAACRKSHIPTVGGESNAMIFGNCVSLINLLRVSGVSIYDFFQNMKIWVDYNNLSSLKDHITRLENQFHVTYHLYNLYKKTFDKIFKMNPNEKKNKKARPVKCTASKLYDLCWKLFLCVKNEDLENSKDFLTSMYLLFSCIDLIFRNAVTDHRTDIIDPNFSGVPKGFSNANGGKDVKCIIPNLCQMHDNIDLNEFVKSSSFITIIQELFKSKTLFGDSTTFMKIISVDNFEPNFKALNNAYEQYVLSAGSFDETIFLKNTSKSNNNEYGVTNTPLTRKDLLPSRDDGEPLIASARKLQDVVAEWREPSEFLRPILTDKFHELMNSFMATFIRKCPEGARRSDVIKSLCYCFLHKILMKEMPKHRGNIDLKVFTENERFIKSLFACCTQIVLDSHFINMPAFPWVLECFELSAFDFSKLIEPIVMEKDGILSREMIKKLNKNEENCLQQLVWSGSSPIWDLIAKEPNIPNFNSVDVRRSTNGDTLLSPMNVPYDHIHRPAQAVGRDLFNVGKAERMEGVQIQYQTQGQQNNVANQNEVSSVNNTPKKRAGSFALFFRKFYKLAYLRIKVFCDDLGIQDCIGVIWTIFENSIVEHTELIRNRHLDQIIMCAIYSYIKVCDINTKFVDIMVTYRKQPQSHSDTYRHVLIKPEEEHPDGRTTPAEYDSIIKYYNDVYVKVMCNYIIKFGPNQQLQMLSPHPNIQHHTFIRIPQSNVVITKLDRKDIPQSPDKFMMEISQNINNNAVAESRLQQFAHINKLIKNGKRTIPFSEDTYITTTTDSCSPKKMSKSVTHFENKLNTIRKDRSTQNVVN